jgi:hypothetical protein
MLPASNVAGSLVGSADAMSVTTLRRSAAAAQLDRSVVLTTYEKSSSHPYAKFSFGYRRDVREVSREFREVSREFREVSREIRDFSRDFSQR